MNKETTDKPENCKVCLKPEGLCFCGTLKPFQNKIKVLILQHPQEKDKVLGTATLALQSLDKAVLKIGLSWRNLDAALGEKVDRSKWGVLYLGSAKTNADKAAKSELFVVDKKGTILPEQAKLLKTLEGIVILDGNWSQAKTLWWRNAWLLKLKRLVITPSQKSLYGKLRKEPRPDSISTIEAVAVTLNELEKTKGVKGLLLTNFEGLLNKYTEMRKR